MKSRVLVCCVVLLFAITLTVVRSDPEKNEFEFAKDGEEQTEFDEFRENEEREPEEWRGKENREDESFQKHHQNKFNRPTKEHHDEKFHHDRGFDNHKTKFGRVRDIKFGRVREIKFGQDDNFFRALKKQHGGKEHHLNVDFPHHKRILDHKEHHRHHKKPHFECRHRPCSLSLFDFRRRFCKSEHVVLVKILAVKEVHKSHTFILKVEVVKQFLGGRRNRMSHKLIVIVPKEVCGLRNHRPEEGSVWLLATSQRDCHRRVVLSVCKENIFVPVKLLSCSIRNFLIWPKCHFKHESEFHHHDFQHGEREFLSKCPKLREKVRQVKLHEVELASLNSLPPYGVEESEIAVNENEENNDDELNEIGNSEEEDNDFSVNELIE